MPAIRHSRRDTCNPALTPADTKTAMGRAERADGARTWPTETCLTAAKGFPLARERLF